MQNNNHAMYVGEIGENEEMEMIQFGFRIDVGKL